MQFEHMNWNFQNTYTRLPRQFYSLIASSPVKDPHLLVLNDPLIKELGLKEYDSHLDLSILAGNEPPPHSAAFAQAYSGHQFGYFTHLGDGRALVLGEHITPDGRRFDIQLKGSGKTPYSRRGDGRAALAPMLREYLVSEAMFSLGIPTTRSLAVVGTGESVFREDILPGAVLTRVASSHIRVGTFEYAATLNLVHELLEYSIERHYPTLLNAENPYFEFLKKVCDKQAYLIAQWMCTGFIHGVMNTDNMLISGETIDYGPCAFIDRFEPDAVFSSIDRNGRYAFSKQMEIGAWNLGRLAESILSSPQQSSSRPILTKELALNALQSYPKLFEEYWTQGMARKIGIVNSSTSDIPLIIHFLSLIQKYQVDYTFAFRSFTDDFLKEKVKSLWIASDFLDWHKLWIDRLSFGGTSLEEANNLMRKVNPIKIPRNYWVEKSISTAQEGDFTTFNHFTEALRNPYALKEEEKVFLDFPHDFQNNYQTFCGT